MKYCKVKVLKPRTIMREKPEDIVVMKFSEDTPHTFNIDDGLYEILEVIEGIITLPKSKNTFSEYERVCRDCSEFFKTDTKKTKTCQPCRDKKRSKYD